MTKSSDTLISPVPGAAVRLILCRHGETALNAAHVLQGSGVDAPLNDRGLKQADALGERLASEPVDWVVSSHLLRARQTADAIAKYHPEALRSSYPDLREISWGDLEGTKVPDLKEMHAAWNSGDFDYALPNGESPNVVSKRSIAQLMEIAATALDRAAKEQCTVTVAIVIHGRLLRIMLAQLLHQSLFFMNAATHTNCNINIFDIVPLDATHPAPPLAGEIDNTAFTHMARVLHASQSLNGVHCQPFQLLDQTVVKKHSATRAYSVEHGQIASVWKSETVGRVVDSVNGYLFVGTQINGTKHLLGV
ncbi:hypothetical protein AMAG_11161 [Allomyces macrogynus ATCC 38327]|uniref:Phosphoglycerate mutase n=1 Tax=Allomyces macrogynus (strain ATCC 38327) TaxID=578462 RepID=A0A0L0SSS5_ALLM3|nr:hypothetical protein AMAG_11161 [Allomyces macrogynus ATCC 38327]|eukprot:KNE65551.1 hypothetical protein AMAG_11161 [Allomyces macrogynus ATCC 38327]